MHVRSDRTVRTPKELWRTLVLALALSVVLFVWSVVVLPALTGEARSQRLVLYWAVVSPIAGTVAAVVIRAVGRRRPGRAPARPRSTRAIVLKSLAFGAPGALGVMLLWVLPREVTPSDLAWWRVAGWIATFVGLTAAIGLLGWVLPELAARRARRKREPREDDAAPGE